MDIFVGNERTIAGNIVADLARRGGDYDARSMLAGAWMVSTFYEPSKEILDRLEVALKEAEAMIEERDGIVFDEIKALAADEPDRLTG